MSEKTCGSTTDSDDEFTEEELCLFMDILTGRADMTDEETVDFMKRISGKTLSIVNR